ncbi:hypothetical protein Moror_9621 [Moniliophthora roreri MCA 2997]|uniref:Fungal-type protein kinase domain-containing protein n=2 Tax=Moniliophthora roreri TaxID=221103 RepID=V2XQW1_MONRO|nr:hypothetical protein Moror_9621 [Moniliophthora roreri MCA 2997]KAI3597586.1 hypothetical protein WG66_003144 [Moniliophthora roreri]
MVRQQHWSERLLRCESQIGNRELDFSGCQRTVPTHRRVVRHRPLGTPLHTFKTTSEVVNAMKDALFAHQKLHEEAGIVHRDISPSHILIGERSEGFLVDWDDDATSETQNRPVQVDETRMGTFEFMSINLLSEPTIFQHPNFVDNLESFYHILSWLALVWGNHDGYYFAVHSKIVSLRYDRRTYDYPTNCRYGSSYKLSDLYRRFTQQVLGLAPGPFRDLLVDMEEVMASRYDGIDDKEADLKHLQFGVKRRYKSRKDMLNNSDWMLARFAKAAHDLSLVEPESTARIDRLLHVHGTCHGERLMYYLV